MRPLAQHLMLGWLFICLRVQVFVGLGSMAFAYSFSMILIEITDTMAQVMTFGMHLVRNTDTMHIPASLSCCCVHVHLTHEALASKMFLVLRKF